MDGIDKLREITTRARRIVFFGGAGVSTASGIPDFRSEGGLYSDLFKGLSPENVHISAFLLVSRRG